VIHYSLSDLDSMFCEPVRAQAHLAAIARAVRPGDVVVEIGTGVGFLAVAAARAGARRVYAIELNPAVILGPEVAAANGCADRITFVRGHSTRVRLPEAADVLVEDMRGMLPMLGDHLPSLMDARARFARPGATIIPVRDALWAAPCVADDELAPRLAPGPGPAAVERGPVVRRLRSSIHRARLEPSRLLAPGTVWAAIDYSTVRSPDVEGRAGWTIERAGQLDGFGIWFDADLGFGCGYSNAPGLPRTNHGQGFLPLEEPLRVAAGDRLGVSIRAKLVEDEYVFAWDTTFEPATDHRMPRTFQQSSLGSAVCTPDQLARRRRDHRPQLGVSARVLEDLLELAGQGLTLAELAERLAASHLGRFRDAGAALAYASRTLGALEDADAEGEVC
jgi:protein arginine N-methyltransferase 1